MASAFSRSLTIPLQRPLKGRLVNPIKQGGGVQPPANFAFIRTVPGTQMKNPPDTYAIGPALSFGVAA